MPKRKKVSEGTVISYKLPVLKGEVRESFYQWINRQESINGLITKALKMQFMLEKMQCEVTTNQKVAKNISYNTLESGRKTDEKSERVKTVQQEKSAPGVNLSIDESKETADIDQLRRMLQSVSRR